MIAVRKAIGPVIQHVLRRNNSKPAYVVLWCMLAIFAIPAENVVSDADVNQMTIPVFYHHLLVTVLVLSLKYARVDILMIHLMM